ncbi:glutaminase [Promicromonospora thailandica]|uniref:Glutaminase n=1 Tax=Promicromonospora thailandica TaxID=765201 RepID=A0A9X2G5K6_9MICO|nr:glutaminase [Promicromonospora thailandica]MCP2267209.1 L-glutaminase [Promicromonospora thailandica]BFF17484.1 glutaminase [Promicromonospora thailandica]
MKTPVPDYLDEVLDGLRGDTSGATADYIPELAEADPERLGMAITTTLGRTYAAGDADTEFTIQSISKPFAYAAAIIDRGLDRVLGAVGVEPSGEAFDELSLEGGTHRPKNPMINAGAITAHSLLVGAQASQEERVERALAFFSRLAGRQLRVDERVCASELGSAHRNLAIAYMLRNYGILDGDVPSVVEGYTRQCSILVTVRDLSVMAATLATGGVQPVTGERLLDPAVARHVMAVMAGAGMYDAAGDWLTRVGIPAKSGVAGGIVGVLPDRVGIGTFSPRLDSHGNSRRGRLAFERLSRDMGMHLFASDGGRLDAVDVEVEVDGGVDKAPGTVTFALRGTVQLTAASELLDLMADSEGTHDVVLDATRVHSFTDLGRRMTLEGLRRLRLDGRAVALRDPAGVLPDPDLGDGTYPDLL